MISSGPPLSPGQAALIPASAATPPAYSDLGNALSMGDALHYLACHWVAVLPFELLQSDLASCARDVARLEDPFRAIQEHVNQQPLLEGSTSGDTQDAEPDPKSIMAHPPRPEMTPTGVSISPKPLPTQLSPNPSQPRSLLLGTSVARFPLSKRAPPHATQSL